MSLLAKKIANLEEYRVKVLTLEREIAELLHLTVPKRTYNKRSPDEPGAEDDDDDDQEKGGGRAWSRVPIPEAKRQEILRRLDGPELGKEIAKSLGVSVGTIKRVAKSGGINLRKRAMAMRQAGYVAPPSVTPGNAPLVTPLDPLEKKILAVRQQGKSHYKIARAVHKDVSFVRAVLKKHGVNKIVTEAQKQEALRLVAEGKLMQKEICAKVGFGKTALARLIAKSKQDK